MNWSGQNGEGIMRSRTLLILLLSICLLAPVVANPNGPPWVNPINGGLTVETGCTCHGDGVPSNDVVVSISGVPRAYALGESYEFTINLQHASYDNGGFLLSDYGSGTFTAGEGTQIVTDTDGSEPGAVSQTAPSNDWVVIWTAPSTDVGDVSFSLAGNAVDGMNGANEGDNWNLLSFFISSPDTMTNDDEENLALRTISVGDFESLFVAEEDPEALEAKRQAEIADDFFTNGNLFYWTTLSIILVGAVVQGEFYERRFGGGPKHLDMRLAVPQGIRRGLLTLAVLLAFGWAVDDGQPWGYALVLGMLTLWGMFGVYRTIVQARANPEHHDLV